MSRYNDEIFRIQDIKGKIAKNFFIRDRSIKKTKKEISIELTSMRKIGKKYDERNAYLVNSSFTDFLNRLADFEITEAYYAFDEKEFDDGFYTKLGFKSNLEADIGDISGYYIINNKNLAIEEFYLNKDMNGQYEKNKWMRYRTTNYQVNVFFEKDPNEGLYFLKYGKYSGRIETTDKDRTFNDTHDVSYILETSDNFGSFEVESNINETKDIFKLKFPYRSEYWNSQNQLLLTKEMQEFIKKMGEENTEFKVSSNMN